jgi:hypothetical protein
MRAMNARIGSAFFAAALWAGAPAAANAAVPGIVGPDFELVAGAAFVSQPDGASIYFWGYGCDAASAPAFAPFPGG